MSSVVTGAWPQNEVDHRNRQPADDRWENLREATSSQNKQNRRRPDGGSSQYRGVSWDAARSKWTAQIKHEGRVRNLGRFTTEEAARDAYAKAAEEHFGDYRPTEVA